MQSILKHSRSTWESCRKLLLNYLILAAFCFLGIIIAYWLPRTDSMKRNLSSALQTINAEGLIYKRAFVDMMLFDLDNLTNQTIISKAAYEDRKHILQSALMNYSASNEEILSGNYTDSPKGMYSRYWHGYLLFLKPALYIMDYQGLRCLNYILIGIMFIGICFLLYKKVNPQTSIAFIISMFAMECYIVPLSLQLCTMFYIALGGTCVVLLANNRLNRKGIENFFFTIGGLTVFFDFLTIPTLSLGLPLLAYVLYNQKGNDWRIVLKSTLYWILGYASIWFTKWGLVYLLTDYNIIADVLHQSLYRIGVLDQTYNPTDQDLTLFKRIGKAFTQLYSNNMLWILVAFVITAGALFFSAPKKEHGYKNNIAFLLIALIPITWFLLLQNHTGIHFRFTHRALIVTIFSGLVYILNIIDWKRIRHPHQFT